MVAFNLLVLFGSSFFYIWIACLDLPRQFVNLHEASQRIGSNWL